ncbi:phosphoenolpyruvate-utilizing protein [Actinomadura sp. LD22]|uniref:Phosphoenolpyruvate-utilizing protein n=1 Tax=Actinomadura physcomitrii TaxID=2650748 RepID=A0A6I4MEA5_9ACTN|nr:PEP-utilizing enzyme [Actinomadura physcomitrii]MWA03210.1 phosphoenolpyruvate-utilizing protein [Actinomadura physcomitrii]
MVDINRPWVVDTPELSGRFPIYTRGNTGEVAGRVSTPLSWSSIGGWPAEIQWRKALVEFGAFDEDEFRPDEMDITALIHGYIYMNLSIARVFGVRMPGASAELMDRAYLGESAGVKPYVAEPGDDAPQYTERIMATVQRVLGARSRPDLEEDARRAAELRAARPDFAAMSDRELLAHHHKIMTGHYGGVLRKHLLMVYESTLVTGMLQEVIAELSDPTLEVRLMGGWGGVASAAPTIGLWRLSRTVRGSGTLTAEFEAGDMAGLDGRLRALSDPDARAFVADFDAFLFEYGSRSTDEWEALPATWETHPHIALGLVDRMRLQSDERSPESLAPRVREEREELTRRLRERLADRPELLGKLDTALQAMAVWMPARELSKTTTIRVLQEARLPFRELGRRHVERGLLESIDDIGLLDIDELGTLIDDPEAVLPLIPERKKWKAELEALEPPFVVDGAVPPVTQWAKRSAPAASPGRSGDVLTGLGACPGAATGRARVIHDPADAIGLEPGEILVAPVTDPGWTPLFASALGVVVNVGSPLSHAAIVSRELGIPAVLAVEQATKRIADGTLITVDGTAGTVTIH